MARTMFTIKDGAIVKITQAELDAHLADPLREGIEIHYEKEAAEAALKRLTEAPDA